MKQYPAQVKKMRKVLLLSAGKWYTGNEILHMGGKHMKTVNIKLSLAENVKNFVNIVNKYPYEIDLRSGRHVIDAKSILGIFSLDLSKPVIVEIYNDDCDDFLEDIKSFII